MRRALLPLVLALTACDEPAAPRFSPTVAALLDEPLWRPRDAYDAAHHLMVPMHAAFARGDQELVARFREFASRAVADSSTMIVDRLDRLQFVWLLSRLMVLDAREGACPAGGAAVSAFVRGDIERTLAEPAWMWDAPDFPSLFARVEWKLARSSTTPSYLRALTDEDLFALAIAADVVTASRACGAAVTPALTRAVALGREAFTTQVTQTASGWLFQPGVWTDHPTFAYAGHTAIAPDLQPLPRPDIAWDSSHFFRFPLMLLAFACADPADPSHFALFRNLRDGLWRQLRDAVLVPPSTQFPAYRLTNYMDGWNGIYRYGYPTQGPGSGYGPYELSGSFALGWWSFLGGEAQQRYATMRSGLPLPLAVVSTYTGPNTTRIRHTAFTEPGYYTGALIVEVVAAAATLGDAWACP